MVGQICALRYFTELRSASSVKQPSPTQYPALFITANHYGSKNKKKAYLKIIKTNYMDLLGNTPYYFKPSFPTYLCSFQNIR